MNGYMFLCSNSTEKECLEKELFGGKLKYLPQVKGVKKGDYLFLYNYTAGKLQGPFEATSELEENIDTEAWGGNFPLQIRVKKKSDSKPLYRPEFEKLIQFGKDNRHPKGSMGSSSLKELISRFESPHRLSEEEIIYRSDNPAHFRADDGHLVRSKGELAIDNWLFANRVPHGYEDLVPVNEPMMYDFLIPLKDNSLLYIEYWGLRDEKYTRRKKEKQKIYKKYNLKLLELTKQDTLKLDKLLLKIKKLVS